MISCNFHCHLNPKKTKEVENKQSNNSKLHTNYQIPRNLTVTAKHSPQFKSIVIVDFQADATNNKQD